MTNRDVVAVAGGGLVFVASGIAARRGTVGSWETRVFQAVNGLPEAIHAPVWVVMQTGSLGGVFAAGATATAVGRRDLGTRLVVVGSSSWVAAKGLKHFVQRGRPSATLEACRTLGRPQSGLGYPSGHAMVAATMAALAGAEGRGLVPALLSVVAVLAGLGRVYVGAHLPLDVVGGLALGGAVGVAAARWRRA